VSAPAGRADLHAHVLPGVDDGARDDAQALAMLRRAVADGTSTIVATPHANRIAPDEIVARVARLTQLATDAGLALEILPGSELRLEPDIAQRWVSGQLLGLNRTRYLLVETPLSGDWPTFADTALYELQLAGAVPILAHVERYSWTRHDFRRLVALAESGVLLQVNSDALDGRRGRAALARARDLARRRLIHLIASDAHAERGRAPLLADALAELARVAGVAAAAEIAQRAADVARGLAVTVPEPRPAPERAGWRGWLRRRASR
jgi:protein-tyrosine phosphatase